MESRTALRTSRAAYVFKQHTHVMLNEGNGSDGHRISLTNHRRTFEPRRFNQPATNQTNLLAFFGLRTIEHKNERAALSCKMCARVYVSPNRARSMSVADSFARRAPNNCRSKTTRAQAQAPPSARRLQFNRSCQPINCRCPFVRRGNVMYSVRCVRRIFESKRALRQQKISTVCFISFSIRRVCRLAVAVFCNERRYWCMFRGDRTRFGMSDGRIDVHSLCTRNCDSQSSSQDNATTPITSTNTHTDYVHLS